MSDEFIEQLQSEQFSEGVGIGIVNTNKRLKKWLGTTLTIESELNKVTRITIHVKNEKI